MSYYKNIVGIDEATKTNLIFLKSIIEPRTGKVLSFSKLIRILSVFLIEKVEDDSFEKELIDFVRDHYGNKPSK